MGVLADSYSLSVFEITVSNDSVLLISYQSILPQSCLGRQLHFQLSLQCMIISSLWSCALPMHVSSYCCHGKWMTVLFLAATYDNGVRSLVQ